MLDFFYQLLRSIRPRQWLKNVALFTAVIFTGQLFKIPLFIITIKTFVIFCLLSSASYLLNDILDAPRDRLHPIKKNRPIASGKFKIQDALTIALVFILVALVSSLRISFGFFLVVTVYLFLQVTYSLIFKHLVLFDILIIASAYILRVFAGEVATGFHISVWLMLTVISLSLFLAIGKRRCELTILAEKALDLSKTRATLGHYSEKLLDTYTAMFANSTWMSYAFYTFIVQRNQPAGFLGDFLPEVVERKWLMLTIPFVIYGIMRYMLLIYEKAEGESPERVLLSDKPLLTTVISWGITVILVIYGLGG